MISPTCQIYRVSQKNVLTLRMTRKPLFMNIERNEIASNTWDKCNWRILFANVQIDDHYKCTHSFFFVLQISCITEAMAGNQLSFEERKFVLKCCWKIENATEVQRRFTKEFAKPPPRAGPLRASETNLKQMEPDKHFRTNFPSSKLSWFPAMASVIQDICNTKKKEWVHL